MSKDAGSPTPKPTRRPAQKSMISRGSGPDATDPQADPQGAATELSTTGRAQEMRAALGVRREAEALLAEASQLRQHAAADADSMVADAEELAGELVGEARGMADQLVAEAQERADGILARARAEADELRENTEAERERMRAEAEAAVHAEVEAERQRASGLLEGAQGALGDLVPLLAGASATVADAIGSLQEIRKPGATASTSVDVLEPAEPAAESVAVTEPVEPVEAPRPPEAPEPRKEVVVGVEDLAGAVPAGSEQVVPAEGDDARPLGWLFRSGQG